MSSQTKFTFECQNCGNCCSGSTGAVWVDDNEIAALANFLNEKVDDFLKKYTRKKNGKITLIEIQKKENDYWCVFLDKNKHCKVYQVRPMQCRTYPYWQKIIENSKNLEITAAECKGIKLE